MEAKFRPTRPETWTWLALNAWAMAATAAELRRALKAEGRARRRLAYQLRLQARLNRVEATAARRRLVERRN